MYTFIQRAKALQREVEEIIYGVAVDSLCLNVRQRAIRDRTPDSVLAGLPGMVNCRPARLCLSGFTARLSR